MSNRVLFLTVFCLSLFLYGCSDSGVSHFSAMMNLPSCKVNNLTDISGDKKSELLFWNTSSMSKSDKFLEQCFFEIINVNSNFFSKGLYSKQIFGEVTDIPVSGYFDDDSVVDYGVYRSYTGQYSDWFLRSGANDNRFSVNFGEPGDLPVPNDYDGDQKYDIAIYRPKDSSFKGIFSKGNGFHIQLGEVGDIPVPKDYDGDGIADLATYRPKGGLWTLKKSRDGSTVQITLGGNSFFPIPSDYDGDGKADLCVFNFYDKSLKALLSGFGRPLSQDIAEKISNQLKEKDFFPVPSDYNGDGASELAFWSKSLKLLVAFELNKELKSKTYRFANITNPIPVNNFILRRIYPNNLNRGSVVSFETNPAFVCFDNGKVLKYEISDTSNKNQKPVSIAKWDKKEKVSPFFSDFDGDYVLESCLWSKETGTFLCESSRVGWRFALELGQKTDVPIYGNFNTDNITDLGIYRKSAGSFMYRYLGKLVPSEIKTVQIADESGKNGIPQIGDCDGDGTDDLAVFNPKKNIFVIKKSSDSHEVKFNFCENSKCTAKAIPVSGDFDGDTKFDPAILEAASGQLKYYSSLNNEIVIQPGFKAHGSVFSADTDMDLMSDLVFFNKLDNSLNVFESSQNFRHRVIKLAGNNTKKVQLINYN